MSKTKITVIAFALCAVIIVAAVIAAVSGKRKPPEAPQPQVQEVTGFDADNSTNISSWEQVPIVSKAQIEMGFTGGEGGQWPLCLTGDNNDGNLMFFGTNVGGLYRSVDGGKSWHKSMKDMLSHGVCDVAIDPNNENRVVCFGTNASKPSYTTGIYISSDMGESWDFKRHFPIGGDKKTIESLAFDPTSFSPGIGGSAVLYLSLVEKTDVLNPTLLTEADRGLYKSADGGLSWSRINADLGDGIVKVTDGGELLVGNYAGLFASSDGGSTFKRILQDNVSGLDVAGGTAFVLTDVKDGENSAVKVWKYENGEVIQISALTPDNVDLVNLNWQNFISLENDTRHAYHFLPSVHRLFSLKVSPADTRNMVANYCSDASYSYNTMYSVDGGLSWHASVREEERKDLKVEDYGFLPHNVHAANFYWSPTENKVWNFESDYVCSSTDFGKTFYWDANGVNALCIGGIFGMNIYDSDIIYTGAQDYNGAVTFDGGKSWEYVDASGASWGGHVYGGYAASREVLYGAQSDGWYNDRYLAISYDGGKTVISHLGDPAYKLSGGDKGRLNGQAGFVSYQSAKNRNVLFCGDLRSADMGKTWSRMKGVTGVFGHDRESGDLYGVDDGAHTVVFSTDDGKTWQTLASASDMNKWWSDMYISDIAVDGKNKLVYVAAGWSSLYKIDIKTGAVTDLTAHIPGAMQKEGMPSPDDINKYSSFSARRIRSVAVDPNHPEIVYAGGSAYGYQSDSGLYRSCDGGETFYVINSNTSTSVVRYGAQGGFEPTCIRVSKSGDLWVAGNCLGFSKLNAPYETEKTRSAPTRKVTLNGADISGFSVHYGRAAVLPTPEKSGYEFAGWYTDPDFTTRYSGEPITEDTAFYAKWREISA